jgi:hypothetical protein
MAKGNDGNLLQHTVEIALARSLAKNADGKLYLVATHGMRPYEPFDDRPTESSPSAYKKLELALRKAGEITKDSHQIPAIINAYIACNASNARYPNSVELVRSMLGDVCGCVTEVVEDKAQVLRQYYDASSITVLHQSWRTNNGAALLLPDRLNKPWLLTLDPMTFVESAYQDDDKLRADDLSLIYLRFSDNQAKSSSKGAIVIACYSMNPRAQRVFKAAIQSHHFPNLRYVETTARGGNRHVAAIGATDSNISDCAVNEWQNTVQWLDSNSK